MIVAVLGVLPLFSASASANMAQTITITSSPPQEAVAGGSYTVSATETSGLEVYFGTEGACSIDEVPRPGAEERLELERPVAEVPHPPFLSPATVDFITAGTCTIKARGFNGSGYEAAPVASQSFPVAKDPSEQITFTSAPPSNATVGGSYNPVVRLSAGIRVSFFTTTPSVCTIAPLHAAVSLGGVGTCTVGVRQEGSPESELPEAQQSFTVYGPVAVVEHPSILPAEPPATQPTPQPTTAPIFPGSTPPPEPAKRTPTNAKHLAKKKKKKKKKKKASANGGIPAKVQARLLKLALAEAARRGEHHPSEIQAVRTTEAEAHTLENAGRPGGTETTSPPPGNTPVYFIQMQGNFRVVCSRGPDMDTCPPARLLMLTVSVSAKRVLGRQFGYGYLNEELPGTPVFLRPVKAHKAPSEHA